LILGKVLIKVYLPGDFYAMFPMVVTHEQGDFKVNFYDGTWKGGWGIE
jgi:hypothetical protein